MSNDIEELLRRSLETRARDITPDPATWTKVERRIHRERAFRFALAGAAAATAAVIAFVTVPTLLDRGNRVDLGPADQPPGSESEQHDVTQTAVPSGPIGTVVASLLSSRLSNPPHNTVGIEVLDEAGQKVLDFPSLFGPDVITDVAVRPGSTTTDLTVIYRLGVGCDAQLAYVSAGSAVQVGGGGASLGADATACPKPAVWSPDGRLAAWVEGEPDAYILRVVEVAQEPNDLGTLFNDVAAWPLQDEALRGLEVVDWLQFNDGRGALHFLGEASDGRVVQAVQNIRMEAAGGVWLFQGGDSFQVLPYLSGASVLAWQDSHQNPGAQAGPSSDRASPGGYMVVADFADDRATNARLTVSGEGDVLEEVALPDEVVSSEKPDGGDVWLAAEGGVVIVGDGHGRAWQATFDGQAWSAVTPLDGDIRHAAFLRPAQVLVEAVDAPTEVTPEPTVTRTEVPPPSPTVAPTATFAPPPPPPSPSPEDEGPGTDLGTGPTAEAAAIRDAIISAAEARDWDGLRELMTEGFSSNYGGEENHIAYYQEAEQNGEDPLGTLIAALELPAGRDADGNFVWPFAHSRDLRSLSSAEKESLAPLASVEEIEAWAEAGSGWLGPRVGIRPDGAWIFYILGGD